MKIIYLNKNSGIPQYVEYKGAEYKFTGNSLIVIHQGRNIVIPLSSVDEIQD